MSVNLKLNKQTLLKYCLFFILLFNVACSPTTSSIRYNKPIKETNKPRDRQKSRVRFTSENDWDIANTNSAESKSSDIASNSKLVKTNKNSTANNIGDNRYNSLPKDNFNFDLNEFKKKYNVVNLENIPVTKRERMLFEIISYLKTPYKWGGSNRNGIDCSAFTKNVYYHADDLELPRTASEQFRVGEFIEVISELQFGDLVFFNTRQDAYPGHVGIYLGENKFVHASGNGVSVASITNKYYKERFVGGRRLDIFSK